VTNDHAPGGFSSLSVAVKRDRTREVVPDQQSGAATLRRATARSGGGAAATARADGKTNADRGWTVFQIPSTPLVPAVRWIEHVRSRSTKVCTGKGLGRHPHLPASARELRWRYTGGPTARRRCSAAASAASVHRPNDAGGLATSSRSASH